MLPKKSPVKLSPLIAGMLDGASHPINPNPITFKSLRSQSLSKHVYLPPEACETLKGFLVVVVDLKKAEFKVVCLRLSDDGEEREEVAKPTTVEVAAVKMLVTTFASNKTPPPYPTTVSAATSHPETPKVHLKSIDRRRILASLAATITPFLAPNPHLNHEESPLPPVFLFPSADARGLFQMPPVRLSNRYFLVRAGESEFESLGIINTNPVAKTSVDNGLSKIGKKQAVKAALRLKEIGACDNGCWIWPSITQRAYQAAEIIAAINGVNRSNIVPEYSFLDARGLGAYEGKALQSVSEIYASDSVSTNIKPPPINDGTPNESVADVFVRVTQLMSILETQYSEDTVIIVSPDSDNLTILQAGLVGLDLRRHSELSFEPGEVRFFDPSSIPTYKQPASALYKCLNPPNCTRV